MDPELPLDDVPMLGAVNAVPPVADPSFDRFAALVRNTLGVPTAMVTIVEENRQVFPGGARTS